MTDTNRTPEVVGVGVIRPKHAAPLRPSPRGSLLRSFWAPVEHITPEGQELRGNFAVEPLEGDEDED